MSVDAVEVKSNASRHLVISSRIDPAKECVVLTSAGSKSAGGAPQEFRVCIGDAVLLSEKDAVKDKFQKSLSFNQAHDHDWTRLQVVVAGSEAPPSAYHLDGEFFEAVSLATPPQFFAKLQLNHLRFQSPFLLEIGAKTAFHRFKSDFVVRAAALTIMAHRLLEKPVTNLTTAERNRGKWIAGQGKEVVRAGQSLIDGVSEPGWQHVRWTISLATVAGYLSLVDNDLESAGSLFAACTQQSKHVNISKVSALNLANACFVYGLICAATERAEDARESFEKGVKTFPDLVNSQNLMTNVWVIGDLLNAGKCSRQCFIALVRFNLFRGAPDAGPYVDELSKLTTSEIKSPLKKILQAGCCPKLSSYLAEHGGD